MLSNTPRRHAPAWVTAIVVAAAMPVVSMPWMLSAASVGSGADIVKTMCYIYPAYVVLTAWLANISYPTRPYMTWILTVLMLLTHAAMWMLVTSPDLN